MSIQITKNVTISGMSYLSSAPSSSLSIQTLVTSLTFGYLGQRKMNYNIRKKTTFKLLKIWIRKIFTKWKVVGEYILLYGIPCII